MPGQTLPLNSARLKGTYLQRIAQSLELPTGSSNAETRQMIEGKLHPVAYASRALNSPEKNYSVTELETLAVVWAVTHFHSYLYGNRVNVITDHASVKAVLETPNPTGKHARWCTRV